MRMRTLTFPPLFLAYLLPSNLPKRYFSCSVTIISFLLQYHLLKVNFIFKGIRNLYRCLVLIKNVIVKHDIYLDAVREINPTEDLHQISLQLNLDLNKNLFVTGQTSFANFGNAEQGLCKTGANL